MSLLFQSISPVARCGAPSPATCFRSVAATPVRRPLSVASNRAFVASNGNTVASNGACGAPSGPSVASNGNAVADNETSVASNENAVANNKPSVAGNKMPVADNRASVDGNGNLAALTGSPVRTNLDY
jgi:hypothetical protein